MIPFYRPFFNHSEFLSTLRVGVRRPTFEATFARRVRATHGLAFAYGRSALVATLRALGIQGAHVVMPAYTCVVVAQAVLATHNIPVFVDINLDDYNIDLALLPNLLTSQTKVVIASHLYGYAADVGAIRDFIGDKPILLIEDRAQCIADVSKTVSQLQSDVAIFSFGLNKELCTVQGGMLVTDAAALYQKVKTYREQALCQTSVKLRLQRWLRFLANYVVFTKWGYESLHRLGLVGLTNFLTDTSDFIPDRLPADYDGRYLDFQARLGLIQLSKLDAVTAKRRALAEFYTQALRDIPGIVLPKSSEDARYTHYTLRVPHAIRFEVYQQMLKRGVAIDMTYEYALPYLKPYRAFALGQEYPNALQAAQQVINLPIYPGLCMKDAKHIVNCFRSVLRELM